MELEKRHTKEEILEMYLNAVYFGEGAYGAQAASRTYFAKPASTAHAGTGRPAGGSTSAAQPARPLQQPGRRDPASERSPARHAAQRLHHQG